MKQSAGFTPDLTRNLASGLDRLGLEIPADVQARLLVFVQLLAKWNRVYNLTAVRDPAAMISHHLLDSLAVAPYVQGERVIDVGTGAGLPGLPLALAYPEKTFVLLDSNSKKTRFITQAVGELGLKNVTVECTRVEAYQPAVLFDTVISRAFASIADMLAVAGHLCRAGGAVVAMKGLYPAGELAALPEGYVLQGVHRVNVPGLEKERHVICINKNRANTGQVGHRLVTL